MGLFKLEKFRCREMLRKRIILCLFRFPLKTARVFLYDKPAKFRSRVPRMSRGARLRVNGPAGALGYCYCRAAALASAVGSFGRAFAVISASPRELASHIGRYVPSIGNDGAWMRPQRGR